MNSSSCALAQPQRANDLSMRSMAGDLDRIPLFCEPDTVSCVLRRRTWPWARRTCTSMPRAMSSDAPVYAAEVLAPDAKAPLEDVE